MFYTSLMRDGALAEIGFRLSLEAVWPSRFEHELHEISARSPRTLYIADLVALGALGVDTARYEGFDYAATQGIAAAAHFLEFDGLKVPSARAACANLVLFMDRLSGVRLAVRSSEPVDWAVWRKSVRPNR